MDRTKTQHTSGPWELQQIEDFHRGYSDWPTFAVRSPQNICLAVVGEVDRFESERIPANARLIAAAPDLLAACRAVYSWAESLSDVTRGMIGCEALGRDFNTVRTAIEKAEGGAR